MTQTQRIIKYAALAFATFLIVSIVSLIMFGILLVSNLWKEPQKETSLEIIPIVEQISTLEFDLEKTNLFIKTGNEFQIETNSQFIEISQEENKMIVKEKKHNWFSNSMEQLILSIPDNLMLEQMKIELGIGQINIDYLNTKKFDLDFGIGKIEIDDLEVSDSATLNIGIADTKINSSVLNQLNLDMGIGNLELSTKLFGNNKMDFGIGNVDLYLMGSLEDYQITLSKGLGVHTLNGTDMKDQVTYGTGNQTIFLDNGIGSLSVYLQE